MFYFVLLITHAILTYVGHSFLWNKVNIFHFMFIS
jgi:hypothetical protein